MRICVRIGCVAALAAASLACGGLTAHRDYDTLCRVVTEEAARPVPDEAERAVRTAERLHSELMPWSTLRNTVLPAIANADPAQRYVLLQAAARDDGYEFWTCPALEAMAAPEEPEEPPEEVDESAFTAELARADQPGPKVVQLLMDHGRDWYGQMPPAHWLTDPAPARFPGALRELGCSEAGQALSPTEEDARVLLASCGPAGQTLLARSAPVDGILVGRAALALWLESTASDDRKQSALHQQLTTALLTGLDVTSPDAPVQ